MRHDIIDAIVLIIAILFSFIGYNISEESNNEKIQSLESKIIHLEYELESIKSYNLNQDTIVVYINQVKKK